MVLWCVISSCKVTETVRVSQSIKRTTRQGKLSLIIRLSFIEIRKVHMYTHTCTITHVSMHTQSKAHMEEREPRVCWQRQKFCVWRMRWVPFFPQNLLVWIITGGPIIQTRKRELDCFQTEELPCLSPRVDLGVTEQLPGEEEVSQAFVLERESAGSQPPKQLSEKYTNPTRTPYLLPNCQGLSKCSLSFPNILYTLAMCIPLLPQYEMEVGFRFVSFHNLAPAN